jgi:hypothetical protein
MLNLALKTKIANEKAKSRAVIDELNRQLLSEQEAITKASAAVDATLKTNKYKAELSVLQQQLSANNSLSFWNKDIIWETTQRKKVEERIRVLEDLIRGAGGAGRSFATGVVNWQGGLARVNENGGEIQYLPRGTTVIPNDISMEIARAVGRASGGGGIDNRLLAENNALMRQLIGLVQTPVRADFNIDGRKTGEALLPRLAEVSIRQGTPILNVR